MSQENMRLNHRIAYLEEHTKDLQMGLKQVRDSLSKTLNTDIHVALSKLGREGLEDENEVLKVERSGSSTSGVYSSAGSVGSDSPDQNSARKIDMTGMIDIPNKDFVSTLTIGNEGLTKIAKI